MRSRKCSCQKCAYCYYRKGYEAHYAQIAEKRKLLSYVHSQRKEHCLKLMGDFLAAKITLEEFENSLMAVQLE